MQVIRNEASLEQAIRQLESRKVSEADDLRSHWDLTRKSLNPLTLLKDGFKDTISSPDFKGNLIKGAISLATGFLTKKLIVGSSAGIAKKVLGTIAQTGVTSLAYKGTDAIKTKGAPFLSGILRKMKIGK